MNNILFISKSEDKIKTIKNFFNNLIYNLDILSDEVEVFEYLQKKSPNIILCDYDNRNYSFDIDLFLKKLKVQAQIDNVVLILILPKDFTNYEILKTANAFIIYPFSKELLIATINSNLRTKNILDVLSKNNSDLARSLYQLDVMYNTSSQLAGTLEQTKLIEIMIEGLEKSLSFQLSYTLICNEQNNFILIINSLHPLSERFEQAIKLRALLSYNNLFLKKESINELNVENIRIIKKVKHEFYEYDLNIFNNDNMFAPISIGEKFFGLIEVFREEEFTQEDATCFQTLAKQVALPLESAILYERIKNTNVRLEQLERLKSEFISIVSHELRTPLTAIKNSLDIILSTNKNNSLPESVIKFTQMAKRNVTRLSAIINDLLDLSKVEAGKMEFHFEKVAIKQPIEFVKNTFENLAKEKNISIDTEMEENIPDLYIDSSRIEQVLTNLVSNAIKFTRENGAIKIETKKIKGSMIDPSILYDQEFDVNKNFDKDFVKVSVIDNGIGIAKENINKVFDKFQQIENSLNRKIGGTGLGLPIAKQLINYQGGVIFLESEPEVRTIFSFALPVLNNLEIFQKKLQDQILKLSTNNILHIGLIAIKEYNNTKIDFSIIEDIVNNKFNLVRNNATKNNSIVINNENNKIYLLFVLDADKFALDFIRKKFETYYHNKLKEYKIENKERIIEYSNVLFPDEGKESKELVGKLLNSFNNVN